MPDSLILKLQFKSEKRSTLIDLLSSIWMGHWKEMRKCDEQIQKLGFSVFSHSQYRSNKGV